MPLFIKTKQAVAISAYVYFTGIVLANGPDIVAGQGIVGSRIVNKFCAILKLKFRA